MAIWLLHAAADLGDDNWRYALVRLFPKPQGKLELLLVGYCHPVQSHLPFLSGTRGVELGGPRGVASLVCFSSWVG